MIKVETIIEFYPGNQQKVNFDWEEWKEIKVDEFYPKATLSN
jgi:formate-dependent nitrite reductase cytochrome c552 subunit